MFKYYGTELNKRRRELKVLIAGFRGLGWEGDAFTPTELSTTRDWLRPAPSTWRGEGTAMPQFAQTCGSGSFPRSTSVMRSPPWSRSSIERDDLWKQGSRT